MDFVNFPSIELFHNVVRGIFSEPPLVTYRGKIKLHGTNASVRLKAGEVVAQSRSRLISPQDDNEGFAKFVQEHMEYFKSIPASNHTIFGEWCGSGIMSGTAINQIKHKIFAVFAILIGNDLMIVSPEKIESFLGGNKKPANIHVLPWYDKEVVVDFNAVEHLQGIADRLSKLVEDLEPCDPWVKSVFGVEGTAEGLVFYPSTRANITLSMFENFAFKAKGEKHKVVKTKHIVQVAPEIAQSVSEFVNMFVTEPRCEQGVAAVGGSLETKNIGAFLKWMCTDIQKESEVELEVSGLTWDQVQKNIQMNARNWFLAKSKKI